MSRFNGLSWTCGAFLAFDFMVYRVCAYRFLAYRCLAFDDNVFGEAGTDIF